MAQRPSYASIAHHDSFCHERLKLAENSIRLFQVQAGGRNEPIRLRMTQYSSQRRPPYKAVSYTWGSSAHLQQVLVNGRSFGIHLNLWSLLSQLRDGKETSFLWADALCIDQANLRERNFHVQLMGKIYDQAQSVIVWLGLPSPDRTEIRAFDFIKDSVLVRASHGDVGFASEYLKTDHLHRWETLSRMCEHIYWTRTWIVQEFLRAPTVEVLCGNHKVDWDGFENLLLLVQRAPFNTNPVIERILHSRTARLTLRRRARTASTLHELLEEYHDSTCTEQRDKVYGILGLASDCMADEMTGQARGIVPDYNKHIVEVYLDAVTCIEKSLISPNLLPSVVNLVRQTLLLSDTDFAEYILQSSIQSENLPSLTIAPEYVGVVEHVVPPWTSIRDLKERLISLDWGLYLGYEMRSARPGLGRRSSTRAMHSALPDDMVQNMINAAEMDPNINSLHNYAPTSDLVIAPSHIALHHEDKRLYGEDKPGKPRVIIEQNEAAGFLRLGFACTNVRRNDLILQFKGLDVAVIVRQVGFDLVLVGKAIMIKNSRLELQHDLDSVCVATPWLSTCPASHNPENICLRTDALSLAELISRE